MSRTPHSQARRARPSARVLALTGLGVAATMSVLSGCGVAEDGVQPGVAARVGGTTVDTGDVDALVTDYCGFVREQRAGEGTAPPRSLIRGEYVALQVRRAVVQELVEETGVDIDAEHAEAVAEAERSFEGADIDADQAAAMVEVQSATDYVALGTYAVGDVLLAEESDSPPASPDVVQARGEQAVTDWLAEHDIDLNPRYGLTVRDGELVGATDLSVGVGELARLADIDFDAEETDPDAQGALMRDVEAYTAELTDDQLC